MTLGQAARFMFFGTLLGAVLAGWFSKSMISWWFSPPVDIAVNCRNAVEWGIDTYRKVMLVGASSGAMLGVVGIVLLRKRKPPSRGPGASDQATTVRSS